LDIIIIGAGASGLAAARELSRAGNKVVVLEARNYLGGRILTVHDSRFPIPIELGAEFIHGDAPAARLLLKEYQIEYSRVSGMMLDLRKESERPNEKDYRLIEKALDELQEDIPIREFLDRNFPAQEFIGIRKMVTGFVEGYESADLERYSTFDFREDWTTPSGSGRWEQYRVVGGYGKLIEAIVEDCKMKGCEVYCSAVVKEIKWGRNKVEAVCEDGRVFHGSKVIISIPLGPLQAEAVSFSPKLPDKVSAAKQLGFGNVAKVLILFKEKFWSNHGDFFFLFSDARIPTWWTQWRTPHPILTGWLSGTGAKEWFDKSDEEIFRVGIQSLSEIFERDFKEKVVAWKVANWSRDIFTRGSYNYATVGAEKYIKILETPAENTLFFTGEIFSEGRSTVEAALAAGIKTANYIKHPSHT
jgi:monoamine oxidase